METRSDGLQTHTFQGDKLTVTSGKRAYDTVKARWEQENNQQTRHTTYWLALVTLVFALLICDVVLLLLYDSVTLDFVVQKIVGSPYVAEGNFKSGYLVLPSIVYLLICFVMFLTGRFFQGTSSIQNSKTCTSCYNAMLLTFLIYALVGLMVDVLYYKGLTRTLYLVLALLHFTIYTVTVILLCQTYST